MQMPAQVVDQLGALRDEAFTMIDEQPDIELGAGESCDRERVKFFAQRRPRDQDRVDDVRLAALAGAAVRTGQAGRQKVNESARRQPEDLPATPDATARPARLSH
jgi:hypothetical protein